MMQPLSVMFTYDAFPLDFTILQVCKIFYISSSNGKVLNVLPHRHLISPPFVDVYGTATLSIQNCFVYLTSALSTFYFQLKKRQKQKICFSSRHFVRPGGRGEVQTLDLMIRGRVFYHLATAAVKRQNTCVNVQLINGKEAPVNRMLDGSTDPT